MLYTLHNVIFVYLLGKSERKTWRNRIPANEDEDLSTSREGKRYCFHLIRVYFRKTISVKQSVE